MKRKNNIFMTAGSMINSQ